MRIYREQSYLLVPIDLYLENHLLPIEYKYVDKFIFILDMLHTCRCRRKWESGGFIPISSIMLQTVLGTRYAKKCLDKLIDLKVIECDGLFKPEEKCLGYRLTYNFGVAVRGVRVKDKKLIIRAQKYLRNRQKVIDFEDKTGVRKHIRKSIRKLKITNDTGVDAFEFCEFWDKTDPQDAREYRADSLKDLKDGEIWLEKDDQGRLYSNLTAMPRDIRKFLEWRDGSLVFSCDFKAMQPSLAATLYGKNSKEKEKYLEMVDSGFYKWVNSKLKQPKDLAVPWVNAGFKKQVFGQFFYGHESVVMNSEVGKIFKQFFPEMYRIVMHKKLKAHNWLAKYLQHAEAVIVLGEVMPKLLYDNIPAVTLHDCIITTENFAARVEKEMRTAFLQECGFPCNVSAEQITMRECVANSVMEWSNYSLDSLLDTFSNSDNNT